METAWIVLGVIGLLVVGGLFAWWAWKVEQERQAGLAAFADKHGFTTTERDDDLWRRWGDDVAPFDQGFDRECRHILKGTWDGRRAILFDYRYHTWETSTDSKGNTTQRKQAHDVAVVAVQTEQRYPSLRVFPENFLGRAWGRLTNSDIQLEWEDFNRAFTVKCPDRRFASDVLHQQMMELLMTDRDLAWSIIGPDVVTTRSGKHDPDHLEDALQSLDRILDLVPDHVRRTDWNVA